MTNEQQQLIQQSWKIFRSIDPKLVGDVFYSKLFSLHPELRAMFPTSMHQQYVKILDMLSIIVCRLDRLDELTRDIQQLAIRHQGYGVKAEHYDLVGDALLWTLAQGFGKDWSIKLETAWQSCFHHLAHQMINASSEVG